MTGHHYVVEGGSVHNVFLRYYLPDSGAIGITSSIREATRYTRDAAIAVAHFLGSSWKAVEVME